MMHISDWYPTILGLAGVEMPKGRVTLDGFNQWPAISRAKSSRRTVSDLHDAFCLENVVRPRGQTARP